jgi:tape measure domain-containing protein
MARYTIDFSTNASAVVREIEKVNREIANVARNGKKVSITLDTSGLKTQLNTTFAQLNREIERMQAKLSKLQIGSQPFRKTAAAMGFREGQVERGQMIAQPLRLRGQAQSFEEGSLTRLQKELQAAQIEAAQIKPATEPWMRLQGEIARISGQLQKADKLAENIKLTNDLGAFSPGSLNQLEAKLTILRNRAREISPNTSEWKALNKEIVKAEQGIQKQTRKPLTRGQRLGAAGGAFLYGGGLGGGAGSAIGGIAGGLMGGVPGAFTGAAIGQAVDTLGQYAAAIAETVAEVNKSRVALAGVTRNVDDYDTALAAATDASNKFLLPISDATRQFARLQASVAGAGYETDTTKKVFDGIASAIVATGGKTEDLNGALLATAQVFSKGKVSAEELRGQIGERLPGAFTVFAASIGKTPQQLDDALQKGEVSLEDFVRFTEELTRRYGKTAEILATAPENAGARLQVALQDASVRYAGFFQVVGAGFQDSITGVLNWARENEDGIKRVATVFAIGFNTIGGLIGKFTKFLVDSFNKAFSHLLGNLETVVARVEEMINRAVAASSLTPKQIQGFQQQADKATKQKYGARIDLGGRNGGINTGIILDQNAAGQYYNKYFNDLVDKATKSRGAKSYTQKMRETLFPDFKPSSFGSGLGGAPTGAGGGGGAGGKAKAGKELKEYTSDRIDILKSEMQQKLAAIDQDESIFSREKELQKARTAMQYEGLILQEQARLAQQEAAKFTPETRGLFLEEKKQEFDREALRLKNEYASVVKGPLMDAAESYNQALDEEAKKLELAILGRERLTFAEETEALIRDKLVGATEEEKQMAEGLIKTLRDLALARDNAFSSNYLLNIENKLRDAREQAAAPLGKEGLVARQQEFRAQGIDPAQAEQVFAQEQELERVQRMRQAFQGLASDINSGLGTAITDIVTDFANMQQHGLTFIETLANAFKSLANTIIQEMTRVMINKAVSQLFSLVMPAIGAGISAGGSGNPFPGHPTHSNVPIAPLPAIPNANGNVLVGGFQAFAKGGIVTGPTLGLVGEGRFNEAVVPLPDGRKIPVELGGGAGNNISTNIVVNMSNGQASSQVSGRGGQAFGREIEGAVRNVILKESRPGGLIYSGR